MGSDEEQTQEKWQKQRYDDILLADERDADTVETRYVPR